MLQRLARVLLASSLLWLPAFTVRAVAAAQTIASTERTWRPLREISPLRFYREMPEAIEFSEVRLMEGDDARWANPDFDDLNWRVITRGGVPYVAARTGILWLRFRVRWNAPEGRLPGGIFLWSLEGSYDCFWDGVLLVHSGVPGRNADEEVVGPNQNRLVLPDRLTGAGEHVVAVRISSFHATSPRSASSLDAVMMTPEDLELRFRRDNVLPVMASGSLFTVCLASVVMWFIAARRRVLLIFGALCFSAGALESLTWFSLGYDYPYTWGYRLHLSGCAAAFAVSVLLGTVVVVEWRIPRARWLVAGLLLVDLAVLAWTWPRTGWFSQEVIGAAFVFLLPCCVWAALHRKHGAWIVAAGVAISGALLVHDPVHYLGTDFLQDFFPIFLALLLTIALGVRLERRAAQETRLTAVRLEIELLKKSLQPHFLMNTLTALAQTVEEEPARAVKLIDDLAQEFRTLARVSGEKTVPLAQELELCRVHLRVMQARTDVPWRLDVDGVDESAVVPPALFLTLIENGFSHQRPQSGEANFRLRAAAIPGGVRYRFLSPGAVTAETGRTGGGTGLRYVRARLEESFSGAWTLTQSEVDGGWETVIELRSTARTTTPA